MHKYNARIMVVEGDAQSRSCLPSALGNEGFACVCVATAQEALDKLASEAIDLVILELGLPGFDDGLEIIKKVSEYVPIIVISARDADADKVSALDNGADDYLTKPFSAAELMARIRVALRNSRRQAARPVISVGELEIDFDKRLVYLKGAQVHMTPLEHKLLFFLARNIGKVVSTKQIIAEVWDASYGPDTSALRSLMAGLRRKIEENPAVPRYILTVTGTGYRFLDS